MKDNRKQPYPDWMVERAVLGELPPDQQAAFLESLNGGDPQLRNRVEALNQSNETVLSSYPPAVIAQRVRNRMDTQRVTSGFFSDGWMQLGRMVSPLGMAPMATAVTALLIVLVGVGGLYGSWMKLGWESVSQPPGSPSVLAVAPDMEGLEPTRIKGLEPGLSVYLLDATGAVNLLADSSTLGADQLIQLGYQAAGAQYGAIVSLDGRGKVTLHLPQHPLDGPARLSSEGETVLQRSFQLDDAPHFERFIFVTAGRTFDLAQVLQAAQNLAQSPDHSKHQSLDLPDWMEQSFFLLLKDDQ